jgi:alkylation response protein AidB-like acyl-CoA dehydrogenase
MAHVDPIARRNDERECGIGSFPEIREACRFEVNMPKLLASEASWAAADMCLQTHGFGFAEA